jgi:nitrate/TMAO reductase-like tetraheme cytochrome c subunit
MVTCTMLLTRCINQQDEAASKIKKTTKPAFAGSASCAGCHKSIAAAHLKTAHFHTSAIASAENIKGSFDAGKNTFNFGHGGMVKMEKRPGGFYQSAVVNGEEKQSQRFDISFGSGKKGQTFAAWANEVLLQLPVGYFTSEDQWCNSPGYANNITLNRVVTSRCLECHTTYMEQISAPGAEPEKFNSATMILGVDCEKCHGSGVEHITYQIAHPEEKKGWFIINPAKFTRSQSLDMCALCHGGVLQKTAASFSFVAGNQLSNYFTIDSSSRNPISIDVHGNQYGMLSASKCFRNSSTMTCMTCHNPHENESGKTATISQRCLSCHSHQLPNAVLCKLSVVWGSKLNTQCTSCHMPEKPSKAIEVLLQGDTSLTAARMHTHLIKNYPDATNKTLDYIKSKSAH